MRLVKSLLWIGLGLGMATSAVAADGEGKSAGFVYSGFGTVTDGGSTGPATFHPGIGGQHFFLRNLGVTVDVGYLGPFRSLGDGFGLLNPGLIVGFNREARTQPFVSGGYCLFFRVGGESGLFFGGGVDHWVGEKWGLRFEFRDNVMSSFDAHFVEGRVGFLFR